MTFRGGKFGFWGGNQQFTAKRLTFVGCDTAVRIIWDWGWVWKTISVRDAAVGFNLTRLDGGTGYIGSAIFLDSTFQNVKQAIVVAPPDPKPGAGATGLVLENVAFKNCDKALADAKGNKLLGSGNYDHWALGPVYGTDGKREYSTGKSFKKNRVSDLLDTRNNGLPSRPYYERSKPQYGEKTASDFVHVKDYGAKGRYFRGYLKTPLSW